MNAEKTLLGRLGLIAAAAVVLLAGCGRGDEDAEAEETATPSRPRSSAVATPSAAPAKDTPKRIHARLLDALDRQSVQVLQTVPTFEVSEERVGSGSSDTGERWTATDFPAAGLRSTLYSTGHFGIDGTSKGWMVANRMRIEVPAGADPCEVPWTDDPALVPEGLECGKEMLPDGRLVVVFSYTNLRETYVIDESSVININTGAPDKADGDLSDAPPPISEFVQRAIALHLAA